MRPLGPLLVGLVAGCSSAPEPAPPAPPRAASDTPPAPVERSAKPGLEHTRARARLGRLSVFFAGVEDGAPSPDAPGGQPVFLCHSSGRLYWSNSEGRVWSRAIGGGLLRELAADGFVGGVACDERGIYYGHRRRLVHMSPDGSKRTLSATSEQPLRITLHQGFAYFDMFRRSAIWRAPVGGGPAARWVRTPRPGQIIADGDHIYWTDYSRGTVNRSTLDGAHVKVLARNQKRPLALVASSRYLFWGSERGGTVRRMPKGGGPIATLAHGQVNHDTLLLYRGYVYWPSWRGKRGEHTVSRVSIDGGPVEVVVESLWMPRALVLVGDRLFFVNKGEATILAVSLR